MKRVTIDAKGMHYTPLNREIRKAVRESAGEIVLSNVLGQRFIGDGLQGSVTLFVHGIPGGDLGMFMSGPRIVVYGNADHAPGNTMDAGTITIHGSAGDAVAHSMRGGTILVRDGIGYRGGIHMKQYEEKIPVLVIGEDARAFLGEYMAGGLVILLRRNRPGIYSERGTGSGIHGGEIFIRGEVDPHSLGVGARASPATPGEISRIAPFIRKYCDAFDCEPGPLLDEPFTRVIPGSARPFANKYTWEQW